MYSRAQSCRILHLLIIMQFYPNSTAVPAYNYNRPLETWNLTVVLRNTAAGELLPIKGHYLYHKIASGQVDKCHKACASKIHKMGAKSPISNKVVKATETTKAAHCHTYGCCLRCFQHQINQPITFTRPAKFKMGYWLFGNIFDSLLITQNHAANHIPVQNNSTYITAKMGRKI